MTNIQPSVNGDHSVSNIATSAVRLSDLATMHREIAALVRAGIPLELGLRSFAGGLSSQLGRLADRIANRLSDGKSLAEAIECESPRESAVYTAVIGAGVRSGRLAEALESLADSCEQIQEARRSVSLAMVHPTAVCLVAYLLFAGFIEIIAPKYIESAESLGFGDDFAFRCMKFVCTNSIVWLIALPILHALFLFSVAYPFRSPRGWFNSGGLYRWLNQSQFAQILKIQIEHGLPMAESFVRAANSTTDSALRAAAVSVSEEVTRGTSFTEAISHARMLPPMMRWMLASGFNQRTLPNSLQLMCDSYRRRAVQRARLLKVWFPAAVTVFVSGGIVFLYGLLFFGVLNSFWLGLLQE